MTSTKLVQWLIGLSLILTFPVLFVDNAFAGIPDFDIDGIIDGIDNCPSDFNPGQEDTDGDGVGDACNDADDADSDEYADFLDNCPSDFNPGQEDTDGDGVGDVCDPFAPITIFLRDISDLSPNVPPTFATDPLTFFVGDIVNLLVTDMNANYDPTSMDPELASVNGIIIPLAENDINSGVFVGSFEAISENTMEYNQPLPLVRAAATLGVSPGGDAILSDIVLDDLTIDGLCFRPVTQPVELVLADGTILEDGSVQVTISYANGLFVDGDTPEFLDMYYLPSGSASWEKVVDNAADFFNDQDSRDFDAMTVTSDPEDTEFGMLGGIISTGQYLLAYDVGCGGGGSGAIGKSGFVVNALAGLVGGTGGSGGNAPPSFGQSSFAIISGGEEGFGGILNDNDAKTLDETKTFKVGEKAVLRFDFTEGGGIGKIEHIGLYTNVRDGQKRQDSDAYIFYNPLKSPQVTVHDPNGLFSEANFELLQKDATHFVLKFELTFAKPMAKSDLILESWNLQKWSSITKIPNAIEVVSSGLVQQTESEPIVDTFIEDVVNDQVIPVWVKTNAKWWSDDTIDNENFISGIEYLVNEGIIKVTLPDTTDNTSISEVQSWIKNTAGWWADDMITDDEFLTAIEWLITNNIIQVV